MIYVKRLVVIGLTFLMSAVQLQAANTDSAGTSVEKNIEILLKSRGCPGCNLQGADLTRGELEGVNLKGADLRGATLMLANMAGADLSGADLRGIRWGGADLAGADLRDAKTDNSSFDGAYIAGALLVEDGEVRKIRATEGEKNTKTMSTPVPTGTNADGETVSAAGGVPVELTDQSKFSPETDHQ